MDLKVGTTVRFELKAGSYVGTIQEVEHNEAGEPTYIVWGLAPRLGAPWREGNVRCKAYRLTYRNEQGEWLPADPEVEVAYLTLNRRDEQQWKTFKCRESKIASKVEVLQKRGVAVLETRVSSLP